MIKTSLPGYWTPQEIADRIGRTPMYVHYKISGRVGRNGKLMAEPVLPALQPQRDLFVEYEVGLQFILSHLSGAAREAFLAEARRCGGSKASHTQPAHELLIVAS